jgi:putative hydrolase of the HAD superfamily
MLVRAVLLDALGTLVRLEPPAPRLREELGRRGVEVDEETAARGMAAEIGYYLEHHMEGRDGASLERLRDRCAEALAGGLGVPGLSGPDVRGALLDSLRFTVYPDVIPALRELRRRGLRLVVASNWDCSLAGRLEEAGLMGLLDGAVSSAVVGEAKPSRAVFLAALRLARVRPHEALHVGDSLDGDVQGARAAGLRAVLLVRDREPPPDVPAIRSLADVPSLT